MPDQTVPSNGATSAPEQNAVGQREKWIKPEFTTFLPVSASDGISYRPNDGISNLT